MTWFTCSWPARRIAFATALLNPTKSIVSHAHLFIRPDKLGAPFHVYPFDTGAGVSGCYGDTVDPHVYLEDYELEPSLSAAQRHIAWAFGGNRQYFEGDLIPGLARRLHAWQSVGLGWLTIAGLA